MKKIFLIIILLLTACKAREYSSEGIVYYDNVRKICIEGHLYYTGYNMLAIKLNDDGTPVKCTK